MGNYGGDVADWIYQPKVPFTGSVRDTAKRNKTRVTRGSKSSWVALYGYALLNDGSQGIVVMFKSGFVAFYDAKDGFDEEVYLAMDAADSKGEFIHAEMYHGPYREIHWIGTPSDTLKQKDRVKKATDKKKGIIDPVEKEREEQRAAIKTAWKALSRKRR